MEHQPSHGSGVTLEDVSAAREIVVRLCTRLTGRPDVAEDLTQETLFVAWRQEGELRDPSKRLQWMLGIARNLCLRWRREEGRALAHTALPGGGDDLQPGSVEHLATSEAPLDLELERHELTELLDRALDLLPPETRAVLVQSYSEELSHSEIGHRLRLSESAVKARLYRGRLALRRVLDHELREEAATYGLSDPATNAWQGTRIWCPDCGGRRLMVRFAEPPGPISFRCPGCDPDPEVVSLEYRLANACFARLIGGLQRPKAILNRVYPWAYEYFSQAAKEGESRCTNCDRPVRVEIVRLPWPPSYTCVPRLVIECGACGEAVSASLGGQVLALPEVQRFWREHPRMRTSSTEVSEAQGRAAVVTSFQSVDGAARLEVVSDRDTFRLLGMHGAVSSREAEL
ncbi:MAG: RNA polymerase sigma factor [Chloroflexota bacterium]|nr:RNA polymerase sigma factor [Chloroflexota bacterium]